MSVFRWMKVSLVFCLILVGITSVNAQSAFVQGVITGEDGQGIPGVSVYLKDYSLGTSTNALGQYRMDNLQPGSHTMIVSGIGYFKLSRDFEIQSDGHLNIDFIMIEEVSSLSEVTIITGGSNGLRDIPGSVQYLTPRELEKFSYTDVNRTLRAVPGVNLQEEDGFGLRPNIGLRGTGVERSSKITVMEDGVLMAPAPYAAPAAYYFPTIGRMQGVEILKGSSQIKYGPYTTGGAINLISTQIPEELSGRLNLIGGSFGGRNLHANVGNTQGRIGFMVETFQYGSDGFKEIDGGSDVGFIKQDYLAKLRVTSKKGAKVFQSLTLKAGQTTEASHETYLGLTQADFDENPIRRYAASQQDKMDTEQSQFSLSHEIEWKGWKLNTVVYRNDFSRNWYKLDSWIDSTGTKHKISNILDAPDMNADAYAALTGSSSTGSVLTVKANNRSYFGQGIQTELSKTFATGKLTHDLTWGARYHEDEIDRFQWIDEYAMQDGVMQLLLSGTPGTESNRVENAKAFSTYLQHQMKWEGFTVTPGVRFENIDLHRWDYGSNDVDRTGTDLSERENQVSVLIPGIGVDYALNEFASVFGGVHKGFAPPSSKEETKPEESINYELGGRFSKNGFFGQAVLFLNDYSNLLGSDLAAAGGGGTGDLFNGGEVETKGLELHLTYDLLAKNTSGLNLPISIVYTYTDAKFLNDFESDFEGWGEVSSGDEFPYLANHQFTTTVGFDHLRYGFNLSARYMDEMRTQPGSGEIPESEKTDSYLVLDASANFNLSPGIALFGSITNVSDQTYVVARRPSGLRPGMPRAFNLGIKARF